MSKWQKIYIAMLLALVSAFASANDSSVADGLFKFHLDLASQGDPQSMYLLGNMYATGRGVTQDYHAAVRWYERALEHGNGRALARIAELAVEIQKEEQRRLALESQRSAKRKVDLDTQEAFDQELSRLSATPEPPQASSSQRSSSPASSQELSPPAEEGSKVFNESASSVLPPQQESPARGWVETKRPASTVQTSDNKATSNAKKASVPEDAPPVAPLGLWAAGAPTHQVNTDQQREGAAPSSKSEMEELLWLGAGEETDDIGLGKNTELSGGAIGQHLGTVKQGSESISEQNNPQQETGFKANPCSSAAARFMSTCN